MRVPADPGMIPYALQSTEESEIAAYVCMLLYLWSLSCRVASLT